MYVANISPTLKYGSIRVCTALFFSTIRFAQLKIQIANPKIPNQYLQKLAQPNFKIKKQFGLLFLKTGIVLVPVSQSIFFFTNLNFFLNEINQNVIHLSNSIQPKCDSSFIRSFFLHTFRYKLYSATLLFRFCCCVYALWVHTHTYIGLVNECPHDTL